MTEIATNDLKNYMGILQPKGFPGLPGGWVSEFETFLSADQRVQLFNVIHHGEPWTGHRALVVSHGLGEHGGRYLHFPHFLRKEVDAVSCLDHRGHGRSEGLRGHVDRFELFTEDLALSIRRLDEQLRKRFGKSEIHLFGHSLGSMIALQTAAAHEDLPIRSLTLSSPMIGLKVKVPLAKKLVARAMAATWGSLQMSNELDASMVSHDPEVVEAYRKDRLVHSKITPKLFAEMTAAMTHSVKEISNLKYPVLMIVPLADQITDPEAALAFFKRLGGDRKLLKTYPGLFHESFNEVGKEKVFEDFQEWIRKNSEASSSDSSGR